MSATLHDTAADRRKATRREWIGLAVVALPCLVYAMDLTVLNLALPVLSRELQPSSAQLLWILDIYGFFVAGFLITMGTLGDRIGRRRLLLIGAALFAFASVLAALADTAALLIAARALLGLAGATIAPSTMALIRNMFHDPRQRQFAIGVWIAAFSLGSAIGPLVGGVLLEFFHWGAVFWLNVPVMLLTLALGPRFLPEYRDPDAGHLDLASVLLSLAAVLLTIYGLKQLAEHGAGLASMAALLAGLAVGALFLRRQGHIAYPLLDLRLFAHAPFRAALAAYALAALAMFGVYIFMTQYLQLVLGLSPLQAGLATLPWSLCFVIGSLLSPQLAARWPAARILVVGLSAAAFGFAVLGLGQGLWWLVPATIVMGLGLAPVPRSGAPCTWPTPCRRGRARPCWRPHARASPMRCRPRPGPARCWCWWPLGWWRACCASAQRSHLVDPLASGPRWIQRAAGGAAAGRMASGGSSGCAR